MSIIDHIAILVDDLSVAEEWYTQKLDGKVTFRDQKYIRMQVSNTTIALICKNHYDYNHVGVLVDNKEDLPQEGKKIEHRDGTIGVYVFDNSGYCVEFIYYSDEVKKKLGL